MNDDKFIKQDKDYQAKVIELTSDGELLSV